MQNTPIVVIGASTGGIIALKHLVSLLPQDLAAAIFVVQHLPQNHPTQLHEILSANGPLQAILPKDSEKFKAGTIYVSKPNHHLLVKSDHVSIVFGPRENRARPSIDALFRAAAAYHTTQVTAVLLTGYLNDGVSGLDAVKRCGGITIVQDPAECEAAELPKAAIANVKIDHILPLSGIAVKLVQIVGRPIGKAHAVPEDIMEEVKVSEHEVPDLDHMQKIGDLTAYSCPECGGSLWKAKNEPLTRYVCHTGHSFSQESYLEGQAEVIENSLWSAIRYVQERIDVIQKMIKTHQEKGQQQFANELEQKVAEMKHHVHILRKFIMSDVLKEITETA